MSPDKATPERSNVVRCSEIKRNGERCRAIAGSDGLCAIHGGRSDPRELGRRGGTKRADRELGVDETLAASEAGRRKLLELTEHADPRVAIAASKALFSVGPTRAPAQGADDASTGWGWVEHHDPDRIIEILKKIGLVAPFLADTAAERRRRPPPPVPPTAERYLVRQVRL
jgi:hypothetical protein